MCVIAVIVPTIKKKKKSSANTAQIHDRAFYNTSHASQAKCAFSYQTAQKLQKRPTHARLHMVRLCPKLCNFAQLFDLNEILLLRLLCLG